jgi:hypothetical protein
MSYKPYSLFRLLEDIDAGRHLLPHIQRPFVWEREQMPHVDHIYPQYMLRSRLSCSTAEINDIGNLRFFGATDNIRKRAELPASYFSRLKAQGVPIERHLLVDEFASDPSKLAFDKATFDRFRALRRDAIWASLKRVVDTEASGESQ